MSVKSKLYQQWGETGEVAKEAAYEERSLKDALHILNDGSGPIFVVADDEDFEGPDSNTCLTVGDPEHEDSTERFQFVVENTDDTVAVFRQASDALWFAMQVVERAAEVSP